MLVLALPSSLSDHATRNEREVLSTFEHDSDSNLLKTTDSLLAVNNTSSVYVWSHSQQRRCYNLL